jgi:hypothetical protein
LSSQKLSVDSWQVTHHQMPRSLTRTKLVLSSALYSSQWFHWIDKNGKLLLDSAMDGMHATFFYVPETHF